MTTTNILSEHGITVPDGESVAVVIYCCHPYCGCLYAFFRSLGEAELRREEAWKALADVRYMPPVGRSSAHLMQSITEAYPEAMVLKSMCCYSLDAPNVFEANACGYCSSLTDHRDGCPGPRDKQPGAAARQRAWYYGFKMGRAGRWNGFIARVHHSSVCVRLGYDRGKKDLEREGPLSSY